MNGKTNEQINSQEAKENQTPPSEASTKTFREKLDNFFYHYKFHSIVALFLVFVLVWMVVTTATSKKADAFVGYIGPRSYTNEEIDKMSESITSALKPSFEGEYEITYCPYKYLSEEQLEQEASKAEELGEDYGYFPVRNEKNYESFTRELDMGDVAVWFVSHDVYERMDKTKLMTVELALGYVPEGAVDEYAIDCATLDISSVLPNTKNTYLILRGYRDYSAIMGQEERDRQLKEDKALYKAVVEYKK